eukprot:1011056_1
MNNLVKVGVYRLDIEEQKELEKLPRDEMTRDGRLNAEILTALHYAKGNVLDRLQDAVTYAIRRLAHRNTNKTVAAESVHVVLRGLKVKCGAVSTNLAALVGAVVGASMEVEADYGAGVPGFVRGFFADIDPYFAHIAVADYLRVSSKSHAEKSRMVQRFQTGIKGLFNDQG